MDRVCAGLGRLGPPTSISDSHRHPRQSGRLAWYLCRRESEKRGACDSCSQITVSRWRLWERIIGWRGPIDLRARPLCKGQIKQPDGPGADWLFRRREILQRTSPSLLARVRWANPSLFPLWVALYAGA